MRRRRHTQKAFPGSSGERTTLRRGCGEKRSRCISTDTPTSRGIAQCFLTVDRQIPSMAGMHRSCLMWQCFRHVWRTSARHGGMMFQNPSAGSSAILEQRESPARGKATAHSRPMNLISTVQLVHSGRSHYSALVVQNNCSGTFRYRVFPNLPSETTRTFPLARLF
jgi:hypothetical protein